MAKINSPIIIIPIIIIIFIIIYNVIVILFPKKSYIDTKPLDIDTKTSNIDTKTSNIDTKPLDINKKMSAIDNDKIALALIGFDIKIVKKENFNGGIIFDSYDKINKNVNNFLNTYIPLIDINNINTLLKENNSNDMQTVINNKKIDLLGYIISENDIILIGHTIYSEDNKTNIILFGLFMFYNLILSLKELSRKQNNSVEFTKTSDMYYLNDYDEVNDFFIYDIPINYTGEISNKLNKDTTIKELDIRNIFQNPEKDKIYKISLINFFRMSIENDFINILKGNTQSLIKMINFNIASKLIIENNDGNITVDTKIVGDIADLRSPSNFTKSFADLMRINNDLTRSTKLLEIVNEIKNTYNNKNNNTQYR